MTTGAATRRRRLCAALIVAVLPGTVAAAAVLAGPAATGANDPCAASEVARTVGSVAKSTGDYLDAHPETNQAMTAMLQQQAGPQSMPAVKSYFEANPKVALDLQSIAQPLTNLSTQCKLPISLPQAMGMLQQAQGGAGLPGLPGGAAPAQPVGGTTGTGPAATGPAAPAATAPVSSPATSPLPGAPRGNAVG